VILEVLRRIEERGIIETTLRIKQLIGQVMRYAVVTGRAAHDPPPALSGALTPKPPVKHHAAPIEPKEVARLLRTMEGCTGSPATRYAVKLAPLLFCRPGELRAMEWADVNFETAEWRYTASKKKRDQIVPLARQAVSALRELHLLAGGGKYVFPGARADSKPMCENTVNKALHRLGIDTQNELTGHGFRAMARTVLRELHGFSKEAIELQINHKVIDPMGGAYDRVSFLPERRRMMQVWADYLDELTG
jgi:integrase